MKAENLVTLALSKENKVDKNCFLDMGLASVIFFTKKCCDACMSLHARVFACMSQHARKFARVSACMSQHARTFARVSACVRILVRYV